jgi:RNA polymerase sigma-70 factor (ECF subfamily)
MDTTDGASQATLLRSMNNLPDYSSEAELLEKCRRQEVDAFEMLYKQHGARLKNVAYRIVGNRQDAEDAVQETFLRGYRSIHGFKGQSSLGTWLCRIAVNVCYDITRKRKPETEFTEVHHQGTAGHGMKLALENAIQRLNPNHRTVFVLFAVEGMKHSEIASVLEIPEGTSKSWLFEAKRELQRMLEVTR